MRVRGGCLCGAVRFELRGTPLRMVHCHCSRCRRAHGAGFVTFVAVRRQDFRWRAGEDRRARFESSPGVFRSFCPTCGSNVPTAPPGTPDVFVHAGSLDDDPGVRPERHIFVGSKAPWHEITDDLERHDAYPARG